MITETIFATSFMGILFMLISKIAEERFGKFHWWAKVAGFIDTQVHESRSFFIQKYFLYKKILFLFFFEFLPAYAYHKIVELKDYLHKKYYISAVNLKGEKRMIRSSGNVSEFLQSIKKDELSVTKNQIERSLGINISEEDGLK